MKKLINDPIQLVPEMIEGLCGADDRLARLRGRDVVLRSDLAAFMHEGKVSIISGGGGGHEPAHAGYVGRGMLTAAVIGPVFTSPSVDAILDAIRTVSTPQGVLLIVKNYTGDRLNFGLAAQIASSMGVKVDVVMVADDVAVSAGRVGRRGIAGTVLVSKIAGAAAEAGLPLDQVKAEAQAAADALFSMGLALGSCTLPSTGCPSFSIGEDEVEYGLGIHGESGIMRSPIAPVDQMISQLVEHISAEARLIYGERVVLLINNLGGTAVQEVSLVTRAALSALRRKSVSVDAVLAGAFLTALEMPGCSITVLRSTDARLDRLLAPANAPAWTCPTIPPSDIQHIAPPPEHLSKLSEGPALAQVHVSRFRACLAAVIASLEAANSELTQLDSIVGDGDIGISLARGAAAIAAEAATLPLDHPAATFHRLGAIARRTIGGTSGPLYAAMLNAMADTIAAGADAAEPCLWAHAFAAGCDAVAAIGGAHAGDRTMLDALLPASAAMTAATGGDAVALATVASVAAGNGAEMTRQMVPRLGRSSYLGERALGHVDPGARAVEICLVALANALVHAPPAPRLKRIERKGRI